jgi:protein-disulfide isomerase
MFIIGGLIAGMPPYWQMKPPPAADSMPTGITEDGHPWIGAENPSLTIVEFSDYMCFQCRKMHFMLRQLITQHPEKIRLIHRHFPMDRLYNPLVAEDYHNGAGKMAMIALYAQSKGQFWRVNDLLFDIAIQKQDFNSKTIAAFMDVERTEIVAALDHSYFRLQLKHDIAVGIDKGITGTPSFIINGTLYTGTIPSYLLQKVSDERE